MARGYQISELARQVEATLHLGGQDFFITGVADLSTANSSQLSFLDHPKYLSYLASTDAGLICMRPTKEFDPTKNYLFCHSPTAVFQQLADLLCHNPHQSATLQGVHPTAWVDPTALIEKGVIIGAYSVIDRHVKIGKNSRIDHHVTIGAGTILGEDCHLHSSVVLREGSILGDRVIIQPGAVIGSCGFGYHSTPEGIHTKLTHHGHVVIENDVEIGANTTIDRARFGATLIGSGTKIDNLVQIGHNVRIGKSNLIVAQAGIAGSTETGFAVILGGQVGVVGHITLADGVMVTAQSGISKEIREKGVYSGSPAMERNRYNRHEALVRKLPEFVERIKKLEKALEGMEVHANLLHQT